MHYNQKAARAFRPVRNVSPPRRPADDDIEDHQRHREQHGQEPLKQLRLRQGMGDRNRVADRCWPSPTQTAIITHPAQEQGYVRSAHPCWGVRWHA